MGRRLFTNTFSFALPPSNRQPAGFRLGFVLLRVVGELVKVCVEKIVATRLLHSQMMHLLLKGINCLLLVMESFQLGLYRISLGNDDLHKLLYRVLTLLLVIVVQAPGIIQFNKLLNALNN